MVIRMQWVFLICKGEWMSDVNDYLCVDADSSNSGIDRAV